MKKIAMFVFNEDPMCFVHVLLNALDMDEKGYEIKIIMEGAATKLIPELAREKHPLHIMWEKVNNFGIMEGVCKACSIKTGTVESAREQNLTLLDDMSGHPGMANYRDDGFEIIIF